LSQTVTKNKKIANNTDYTVHVCGCCEPRGDLGSNLLLQVLVVAFITTLLSFPNPYTRMNTSELIRQLVSRCGPEDTYDLW